MKGIKTLYFDGGVIGSGTSQEGGVWAFCAVDENDELVFYKSGFHKTEGGTTNNHTEFIAAVNALEAMDAGWSGVLSGDSKITLGRLFEGWKCKNLPAEYVTRARMALARLGVVTPFHIDGHPTKAHLEAGVGKKGNPVSRWNKKCDDLCGEEKVKYAERKSED